MTSSSISPDATVIGTQSKRDCSFDSKGIPPGSRGRRAAQRRAAARVYTRLGLATLLTAFRGPRRPGPQVMRLR